MHRPGARHREKKVRDIYVSRPFQGLSGEGDWVAMRELVPAATATVRLAGEYAARYPDREITVATVLPLAWPALAKPDGRIFFGPAAQHPERRREPGYRAGSTAGARLRAGASVSVPALPGIGPRLQDVLAPDPLEVTVQDGFDFWLDEESTDPEVIASLERANASVFPTVRLSAVESAYWCRFPEKAHVRWVLTDDEDAALDALARVSAAGGLPLGEGTEFAGMFRAHGLLVPVWDLPTGPDASTWDAPIAAFAERYRAALADARLPRRRSAASAAGVCWAASSLCADWRG